MLQDLFLDALAGLCYAEQQLKKALPKMAEATTEEHLKLAD
jgi:ferritin-like metal-binding protein YciE